MSCSRGCGQRYYDWLKQPISNPIKKTPNCFARCAGRLLRVMASTPLGACSSIFRSEEIRSKHRVTRLTREAKLHALLGYRIRRWPSASCRSSFRISCAAIHHHAVECCWVTDITSIRTYKGRLDLAGVMALFLASDRGLGCPCHDSQRYLVAKRPYDETLRPRRIILAFLIGCSTLFTRSTQDRYRTRSDRV
jgi:hypothetical protein